MSKSSKNNKHTKNVEKHNKIAYKRTMKYETYLDGKTKTAPPVGFDPVEILPSLMGFQRDIVTWALRRGRAAIFADCGMGKTIMQLEWARNVCRHTNGSVLILAPLAVAQQTVDESSTFNIGCNARFLREDDNHRGIVVTNYEMMEHFDLGRFDGIVLDESSILKSKTGKIRTAIISAFKMTPYRLACTATPAPNDHIELGNHSEFLGAMTTSEMLSTYFVHDGGSTQNWRLKGHAKSDFWRWVCSWAIMIRKPSDLGYDDNDFILPPMDIEQITVEVERSEGFLFAMEAETLQERIAARRSSVAERVAACAEIVNSSNEPWLIWCGLNNESQMLAKQIADAVEVSGSDKNEVKEDRMRRFSSGEIRVLVTKPKICGFGMNWQHCRNVAFVGLSDSWESYYQAVRRCWRFGQKNDVYVKIITASTEGAVVANIERKEKAAEEMTAGMLAEMIDITRENIGSTGRTFIEYNPNQEMRIPSWLK